MRHGLIEHFFAGSSPTVDYLCRQVLGDNWVRVNGPLTHASEDLDAVSRGNIANLKDLAERWYEREGAKVRALLAP